jgi:hypothetical protein
MPIPAFQDPTPGVVCCESWFDIVETLTLAVQTAVIDCFPQCADIVAKVTHAEPIGGGDYVAGWLISVGPYATDTPQWGALPPRLTMGLAVCLGDYPGPTTTDGGQIQPVPSPAEYMHASYYTYGVAQIMWQTVASNAIAGKANTPFARCSRVILGPLVPQEPALYSARWGMTLSVDVGRGV